MRRSAAIRPQAETAYFAGGCFWHIEEAFRQTLGVLSAESGYMGGTTGDPTYGAVCSGRTGHAETVKVTYDPGAISYRELLDLFWSIHDPTSVNSQGPDIGSQYRSAIFFTDETQRKLTMDSFRALKASGRFKKPVATQIIKAGDFFKAEDYHQGYLQKHPRFSCGL